MTDLESVDWTRYIAYSPMCIYIERERERVLYTEDDSAKIIIFFVFGVCLFF